MTSQRITTRHVVLVLMLGLVILLLQIGLAGAAVNDGLNWSVGCDGFTSSGGSILLDRDNTGEGRELITINATDGAGNVIFSLRETAPVEAGMFFQAGELVSWTQVPVANPLTVTVVSSAGNGQPAQTVYTVSGSCDRLATTLEGGQALPGGVALISGETSPSVPLNVFPPRPSNPPGAAETSGPGYLIVDTYSLNMRSGPGPEYTLVGRISGSTRLIVVGRTEDRSWWLVQVGDIRGWVNGEYTVVRGDLTNIPVATVEGELAPVRFVLYHTNPVYEHPTESSFWICVIPGNLEYPVVGTNADGDWFAIEVDCDGQTVVGWIAGELGAIRNSGDRPIPFREP